MANPVAPPAALIRRELREMRAATQDRGRATGNWYMGVLAVALFTSMLYAQMGTTLDVHSCTAGVCRGAAARGWIAAALGLALLAAGSRLVRLAGPLGADAATLTWVHASPVRRSDLLRPRSTGVLALAGLAGAAAGGLVALTTAHPSWAGVIASLSLFGLAGVAVGALGCLAQARPVVATVLRHVETTTAILVVLLLVAALLGAHGAVRVPVAMMWTGVAATGVAALAAVVTSLRSLDALPAHELRRGGLAQGAATSAAVMVDPGVVATYAQGSRAATTGRFPSRSLRGTGAWAMAALEARRLRRRPWLVASVTATSLLPAVVAALAGRLPGVVLAVVVLLGLGRLLSEGVAAWSRSSGLRRMIPSSSAGVRMAMLLPPAALLAGWAGVVVGLGRLPVVFWPLLVLGGLAALVRSAEPPAAPDFSRLVYTEAGAIPVDFVLSLAVGLLEAVACVLPGLFLPAHLAIGLAVVVLVSTLRRASWR